MQFSCGGQPLDNFVDHQLLRVRAFIRQWLVRVSLYPLAGNPFPHDIDENFRIKWFEDDFKGSHPDRSQGHFELGVPGYQDDRCVPINFMNIFKESDSVHLRHLEIGHDDVGRFFLESS